MKKRKWTAFMAALTLALCVPQVCPESPAVIVAEAHGGRTDRNGGHPAHLHTNGICPYDSSAAAAASETAAAAQTQTVPENISMVFDARYYADHYEDLYAAYGYDEEQLLNHFLSSGMKEGRVACEAFDVSVYKENNPDLVRAYGDDLPAYYGHYMSCGHSEERVCH